MRYYLISLLFVLISCNGQKKVSEENSGSEGDKNASLVLLLQDDYIGFEVQETLIIKDQKRLKSFYSKINRTRKPGLPVPIIDFSKEMVIVVCAGEQNQVASPTLTFHRESESEIILTSELVQNGVEASSAVINNPFCLYKMQLTDKEIVVKHP